MFTFYIKGSYSIYVGIVHLLFLKKGTENEISKALFTSLLNICRSYILIFVLVNNMLSGIEKKHFFKKKIYIH
jgi:hypothetical protein